MIVTDLRFEKIMDWLMDRLPVYMMWVVGALLILVVGIQTGLVKGRTLEREDILKQVQDDMAENRRHIEELKVKIIEMEERLEKELEHQKLIRAIAKCESNFRHQGVWGDGGKSYGMFQFKKSSFIFLAKRMGFLNGNWKNKGHQILVASWAFKNGYSYWWSCYKKVTKK